MNTTAFTIAKKNIAMLREVAVASKLVTDTPSTSNMVVLRFIRENTIGIVGPDIATASANRLTTNPALDILT